MHSYKNAFAVLVITMTLNMPAALYAQEEPEIKLDTYEIVGRDTRIFNIVGDRKSTVVFGSIPIVQPREERKRELSPGLMTEDERIVRDEDFTTAQGLHGSAVFETGYRKPADLWAKGSASSSNTGLTLGLTNRTAKLNTPENMAPNAQNIDAAAYLEASRARFSASIGYDRQGEEIDDKYFRGVDRKADLLGGKFFMTAPLFNTWDISGGFAVSSATYEDPDLNSDLDEHTLNGYADIKGDAGDMTLDFRGSGARYELDDKYGTVFNGGGTGTVLLADHVGMKLGAAFSASEMPGDDTDINIYPRLEMEWLITEIIALELSYRPQLIEHSFRTLYNTNGLITYNTPLLFENRKLDASGRITIRPYSGISAEIEAFVHKTDDALVFNQASNTDYFEIVSGANLDVTGFEVKADYAWSEYLEFNCVATFRNAEWNYSGDVPYIPDMTGTFTGFYNIQRYLTVYGSLHYYGEHYIVRDSTDKEDGFYTLDVGTELTFWHDSIGLYVEACNLTDNDGAWWTTPYHIPGVGLYAGLRGTY